MRINVQLLVFSCLFSFMENESAAVKNIQDGQQFKLISREKPRFVLESNRVAFDMISASKSVAHAIMLEINGLPIEQRERLSQVIAEKQEVMFKLTQHKAFHYTPVDVPAELKMLAAALVKRIDQSKNLNQDIIWKVSVQKQN